MNLRRSRQSREQGAERAKGAEGAMGAKGAKAAEGAERARWRRWPVRSVYLHLVCLAALGMLLIGGVGPAAHGAIDLAMADLPVPPVKAGGYLSGDRKVPGYVIDLQREYEEEQQRESARHEALISLLGGLGITVIARPVYWFHWRRTRREDAQGGWTAVPWSARSTYHYLVCGISLAAILIGGCVLMTELVDLQLADVHHHLDPLTIYTKAEAGGKMVTVVDIRAEMQADEERMHRSEMYSERRTVFHWAVVVLIALPIYFYHWRRTQRDYARARAC